MDAYGIVVLGDGDGALWRRAGWVFVRDGKAYSANKLENNQFEIRYEIQTLRDCAFCGVDAGEFGITRE